MTAKDVVDQIVDQWGRARPDIDASPMGVLGRLSRLSRLAEREQQKLFSRLGLQPGEFDLLATLRRASPPEGMTAGALAAAAMKTSGAITNRIDRLLAKDLVTRDIDPSNRRSILIGLSPTGKRLIDQAVVAHLDNERRILAALGADRQAALADLLRELLLSLGDTAEAR